MKTAIIKSKNDITQELEVEGTGELISCMDRQEDRSFWEVKIRGRKGTCCRWILDSSIKEEAD